MYYYLTRIDSYLQIMDLANTAVCHFCDKKRKKFSPIEISKNYPIISVELSKQNLKIDILNF